MRVGFRNADYSALEAFWNSVAPPQFPLTVAQMRTHWIGSPTFDWGVSAIELGLDEPVAVLAVKRSPFGLYPGPSRDTSHIAAFACRECEHGVDLLASAKQVLRDRGVSRLVFGQDSMHLFPGCPDNWPKLHDFLIVEGFQERGSAHDLVLDLASFKPRCDIAPQVRRCAMTDVPALERFLQREFPGRWRYDTLQKVDIEERADFIFGLFLDGECQGFVLTQDETHTLPIAGAAFLQPLGPEACAIGPIGVAANLRGSGWGDRLLATSLQELKDAGHRNCRVDWTTLVEWYGKHGFNLERTYTTMVLDLEHGSDEPFASGQNV